MLMRLILIGGYLASFLVCAVLSILCFSWLRVLLNVCMYVCGDICGLIVKLI